MATVTTTTEETAFAQVAKLSKKLDARAGEIQRYERYYEGEHDLRFATKKFKDAFGALFREFADNYCGLVVDSTSERLRIEGFRIPTLQKEKEREEAIEAQEKAKEEAAEQVHALAMAKVQAATAAHESNTAQAQATAATAAVAKPKNEDKPAESDEAQTKESAVSDSPSEPAAPAPAPMLDPAAAEAEAQAELEDNAPDNSEELQQTMIGDTSTGDDDAWEIWQRNNLDLESDIAHETALVAGYAYIMVGPQDDGSTENPLITVEHPLEVITASAPGSPRTVTSAIKRWYDEDENRWYLTLYMPDSIWRFQSNSESRNAPDGPGNRVTTSPIPTKWVPRDGAELKAKNPFPGGKVPVIPLVNRQKMNGAGRSELTDIIPLQDAINKLCNDMLVASEFAAFRQRILTGMEIPEDEHGNIIPDFDLKAAIDRIIVVKDENVGVHEFAVTDLKTYVVAIEHLRDDIAAISRTPPQYLVGEVVNVSSEALKAAESGLVQKAKRRSRYFGESWEEAMRLAFLLKGDEERAESYAAETIWANPEVMTEAALADSLAKYAVLGVPMVAIWERMNVSQTEIKRWLQLKKTEPEPPTGMPAAYGALIKAGDKQVS